ncbi:MAG: DNA-binding response regulator [Gammaproteobacteria bacterium RBG_16_66_13]|nr:MAG: DNA-binding response regulator [Gammaproteobacteria bacterium RBG_16_66_13]
METIRLLLVDDQRLFRRGLRALLEAQEGFHVVSEAENGQEAIDKARAFRPDVILMDVHMPILGGAEATQVIKQEMPNAKVIALTVSDEDDDLFSTIKAGADGYLLKDLGPDELEACIRKVMGGETPLSPGISAKLLREFRDRSFAEKKRTSEADLTSREIEILQLIAEGHSNSDIAAKLYIVEGTVKNHVHNILEKLHLQNRVQAAAYAIRGGLASVNGSEADESGSTARA